jgi:hypothetical protein
MHAAEFLGLLFGIEPSPPAEIYPYSPSLRVGSMTFMFGEAEWVPKHLAFHVTPAEFDGILGRIREHSLTHGDGPWQADNSKVKTGDSANGYRAVWLHSPSPDTTLLEFFCFDVIPDGFSDPAVL